MPDYIRRDDGTLCTGMYRAPVPSADSDAAFRPPGAYGRQYPSFRSIDFATRSAAWLSVASSRWT